MTDDKYRPPVAERQISDRTEPVKFTMTNEWFYSEGSDCKCCPGRHVFGQWAHAGEDRPADLLAAAAAEFGDDAELIVEVRRA